MLTDDCETVVDIDNTYTYKRRKSSMRTNEKDRTQASADDFEDMSLQGARTEHIRRHDDRGLSLLDPLNLLDLLQNEIGECGQVRNLDKGDNVEGPGNSMRHLHTLDLRDRLGSSLGLASSQLHQNI